jgi:hypothetical protein
MLITHPKGLYLIEFDSERRFVYEAPIGQWTKEDYAEYHSQYVNKIGPALGKRPWAICSDLRKYKISELGVIISKHIDWLQENNLQYIVLIVDDIFVKMQVNRAIAGKIPQHVFLNEEDAEAWLKVKGYTIIE